MLRLLTVLALLSAAPQAWAYYDPGVQRWLNRDPAMEQGFELVRLQNRISSVAPISRPAYANLRVEIGPESPPSDNAYSYADSPNLYALTVNSPVNYIDGLGLSPIEVIEMLSPPEAGGGACPECTPTGITIFKSPQGRPVRRSCHYECSWGSKSKYQVIIDVGPRTPCPSGQDASERQRRYG